MSKLFTAVEAYAEQLMGYAEQDQAEQFYAVYAELEAFCESHKGKKSDHPVLWETLADFSEENKVAIAHYQYAYALADQAKDVEYKASIQLALAQRYYEDKVLPMALEAIEKAVKFARFTEDDELQAEAEALCGDIKALV